MIRSHIEKKDFALYLEKEWDKTFPGHEKEIPSSQTAQEDKLSESDSLSSARRKVNAKKGGSSNPPSP